MFLETLLFAHLYDIVLKDAEEKQKRLKERARQLIEEARSSIGRPETLPRQSESPKKAMSRSSSGESGMKCSCIVGF